MINDKHINIMFKHQSFEMEQIFYGCITLKKHSQSDGEGMVYVDRRLSND